MVSLISPYADALTSFVNADTGVSSGSADSQRATLKFSSEYRARLIPGLRRAEISRLRASREEVGLLDTLRESQGGIASSANISAHQGLRRLDPQLQDITGQIDLALPVIEMEINPNSIEFDQPKRFARQDTQEGSVFHHFTNSKGQNNDILTMRFKGNTGNISRRSNDPAQIDRATQRLAVWHNLWQLTREPPLLSDGSVNTIEIFYASALFPVRITFSGFFSKVLTFSEDATKPNSRNYTMEFIVQKTFPDLNVITYMTQQFITQAASASPSDSAQHLTPTEAPIDFTGTI